MDKKSAGLLAEFQAGTCMFAGQLLGCHRLTGRNRRGYVFRLWAPEAQAAWVTGAFTGGTPAAMSPVGGGVWELFSPLPEEGMAYQFRLQLPGETPVAVADPCASLAGPENTALVYTGQQPFAWTDSRWMREFPQREHLTAPMHICGIDYRPDIQPAWLRDMGYTHVELGGLITPETPFALPAALGPPEALKALVNGLHRAGLAVLARWPASLCLGLPRPAGSARPQEKSLLLSCAAYWLEAYHLDGLRVETPENPGRPVRDVLLAVNRAADRVRPNAVLISGGTPGGSPPGDFLLRWRPDWATDGAGWLGRDLLPAPETGDSPRDRALLALMMALPGKKYTPCQDSAFVRSLNQFYLSRCQLWQNETEGYIPVLAQGDVLAFRRLDRRARELLVICNFGRREKENFSLPVPRRGIYRPAFHTGAMPHPAEGRKSGGGFAAEFCLPPESVTFYLRSNLPRQKE